MSEKKYGRTPFPDKYGELGGGGNNENSITKELYKTAVQHLGSRTKSPKTMQSTKSVGNIRHARVTRGV